MKRNVFCSAAAMVAVVAGAVNPYINKVYEYRPAPGQFVHETPLLTSDMSPEQVIAEVELQICGNEVDGPMPGMISLGSFGGYVVFGFDHPVVNMADSYDFKIYGNAFQSITESRPGGSSKPGIVMVSEDTNGNGLPDDPWFELAGSEYANPSTFHGFTVTYTRPASPDAQSYPWTSNDPDLPSGTIERNQFHTQDYWPSWLDEQELTFTGTRLAPNGESLTPDGQNWFLSFLPWGYADNRPNADDPGFKIDWAVDSDGKPAGLSQINFVKVYTGVLQSCGWLGNTATSVCGAEDLHPDRDVNSIETVIAPAAQAVEYFTLRGERVSPPLAPGVYVSRQGAVAAKVIVR